MTDRHALRTPRADAPAPPEARMLGHPQPGYWLMRKAKGAPLVPARIWWHCTDYEPGNALNRMERSPILSAEIAGELVPLSRVWEHRGHEITPDEFRFRLAEAAWLRENAPDDPIANPDKAVDLRALAPIMPPGR